MTIGLGDTLPAGEFRRMGNDGMETVTTDTLFSGRKVVLFSVPGAFTPTCSAKHLPGFVEKAADLKAKGVDEIVCIAVNDPFVMKVWGEHAHAGDAVSLLSDGNGAFTKALGLSVDLSAAFLGERGRRFAMVIDDGKVTHLGIEESPGVVDVSGAESVLEKL